VQLLKPQTAWQQTKLASYVKKFNALNDNQTVPNVETTYWCRLIRLPEDFAAKVFLLLNLNLIDFCCFLWVYWRK